MMKIIAILTVVQMVLCSLRLCETQKTELALCSSSSPPCIQKQAVSQQVCIGENASAVEQLELPLSVIQGVVIMDISVNRFEERIIQGLSKNPRNPEQERWKMSYTFYETGNKCGVLSVTTNVNNVQPEDEFMSHVEIQVGNQILTTPPEIWFTVNNRCDMATIPTADALDTVPKSTASDALLNQIHILNDSTDIRDECFNIKNCFTSLTLASASSNNSLLYRTYITLLDFGILITLLLLGNIALSLKRLIYLMKHSNVCTVIQQEKM